MRHLAATTLGLSILVACNSKTVTLAQLPQELQGAVCQHEASCGVVAESDCNTMNVGAVQLALAVQTLEPVLVIASHASDPEILAAIDAKVTSYSSDKASSCIDGILDMGCDTTAQSDRVVPAACFAILVGTAAAGAGCQRDEECASNDCNTSPCADPGGMCCTTATCQDHSPSPVGDGDACDQSASLTRVGAVCGAGLFCDNTGHCGPLTAANSGCSSVAASCGYGLTCINGTCAPAPAFAAACVGVCRDEGAACGVAGSATTNTCIGLLFQSQDCSTNACSGFYPCDPTQTTPVCLPVALDGQYCTSNSFCANSEFCNVGAGPNGGACSTLLGSGSACTTSAQCATALCGSAGLCEPIAVCTQ